jgi:hypothetical protein
VTTGVVRRACAVVVAVATLAAACGDLDVDDALESEGPALGPPTARAGPCEEVEPASRRFDDVVPGTFYDRPVGWLVTSGLARGRSSSAFSPLEAVTAAELDDVLGRFLARHGG